MNILMYITLPEADLTRVYRDVLKYVHANNEYSQGTLLNVNNFKTLFPFLYFEFNKTKNGYQRWYHKADIPL